MGLWLQLVCCAWVSSLGVLNLCSRSEPIRGKWRTNVLMWRQQFSPRELWEFGDDRVGWYSVRLGISWIDLEYQAVVYDQRTMASIVLFGVLSLKLTQGDGWEGRVRESRGQVELEGMGIKTVRWWRGDEIRTQQDIQTKVLELQSPGLYGIICTKAVSEDQNWRAQERY